MRTRSLTFLVLALLLPAGLAAAPGIPWETIHVTGHSHIDMAWKWDYTEGEQVCVDTFRSVLDLMDRYDGEPGGNPMYYAQSSAWAYNRMAKQHPEILARIRQRVAEGRWEVVGGMWVEADASLPSGESFCRQFLYGQWTFFDLFGFVPTIGWLPDSFGFNANLPQFLRRAGLDRFYLYKLNWNDTHPPTRNLVRWIAPDGSEVLTHVGYVSYGGDATTKRINDGVAIKRANEPQETTVFYPIGFGDHGGGIAENDVIKMLAFRDSGYAVRFGTVADYFDSVGAGAAGVVDRQELYFESHRGTYTSRALHKKNVREIEYLLQDAEIFSALAYLLGEPYPDAFLDEAWKRLLRDEFHDTMSGTCLETVYTGQVAENLGRARALGEDALGDGLGAIAARIDTADLAGDAIAVFNPSGFPVTQPVLLATPARDRHVVDDRGDLVPCQYSEADGAIVFSAADVPAWGWRTFAVAPGACVGESAFPATSRSIENERVRVTLDDSGYVTSLVRADLGREYVQPGQRANRLQLYPDNPDHFDAWDLGFNKYTDAPTEVGGVLSISLVETGPVRQVIEVRRAGAAESYVQRVILYAGADAVDFETLVIGWGKPAHRFLKVAFPLAIDNPAKTVRHNLPYGWLPRVLDGHRADTEFVGHKWVDLTETAADGAFGSAGATLYSREKFGYDVANDGVGEGLSDGRCNVLRLSLLKSGTSPFSRNIDRGGPVTDRGDFLTRYRLVLHGGDLPPAELYRRGESYANPLLPRTTDSHAGFLPAAGSLIEFGGGDVIPTTLKRPLRDASDRELVLRAVEIGGADGEARAVRSAWPIASARRADLLERADDVELADGAGGFSMTVGPSAIETARVVFAESGSGEDEDSDEDDGGGGACGG
jgi:alpha-mannosidase